MDRNDYGDQKGIFVIDTNDDTEEFIPNNVSPVFKKVRVVNEEDVELLETLKNSKDYIDLAISNNLLITNRKLRRKLEVILEKSNFASVEYIDDITKELVDDEEVNESVEINDETLEISIALDYEEYVKEYILKQKYDNDKFKQGIITEYNDIIKIYKDNLQKTMIKLKLINPDNIYQSIRTKNQGEARPAQRLSFWMLDRGTGSDTTRDGV